MQRYLELNIDVALSDEEGFWRNHQQWLEQQGYILRQRYDPRWVPSWNASPAISIHKSEDSLRPGAMLGFLMDAIRVSDGQQVILKRSRVMDFIVEPGIGALFSSTVLLRNSDNHCIPFYDVIGTPDSSAHVLIVMPFLLPFYEPQFATIGEIVEFFREILEGLQFMHRQNIAHCDVKVNNIMSDSLHLYRKRPHPTYTRTDLTNTGDPKVEWNRSERPVKHYLVDFGISRHFPGGHARLRAPRFGGMWQSVPEFRDLTYSYCNPFAVDVFCMGEMIRSNFLVGESLFIPYRGLEFMEDLVADMVQVDPKRRPSMDEVMTRFTAIVWDLSDSKLQSRAVTMNEPLERVDPPKSYNFWLRLLGFLRKWYN
ncbi:kinase-like domain-containing protein [Cyathus striatus]|nr:kinase-like domain-containing protein [Cyathus striatus]